MKRKEYLILLGKVWIRCLQSSSELACPLIVVKPLLVHKVNDDNVKGNPIPKAQFPLHLLMVDPKFDALVYISFCLENNLICFVHCNKLNCLLLAGFMVCYMWLLFQIQVSPNYKNYGLHSFKVTIQRMRLLLMRRG